VKYNNIRQSFFISYRMNQVINDKSSTYVMLEKYTVKYLIDFRNYNSDDACKYLLSKTIFLYNLKFM
jgi:hypothetical protein